MNVSHEWLKAFVAHQLAPEQLRDLITSRSATVDEVVALRADLAPIVIARVVEAARHPDSDRLSVTKVDAGTGELLDVVCGAPNVAAGKLYPFAPVGTVMPGGLRIEKRKIRGALSAGMLCSASELGLGTDKDGILELDVDAEPGTPFLRAVPVGDTRLVIDVSPNRPDLLSHLGVAREVAAATGIPLQLPEIPAGGVEAPAAVREPREGRAGPVTVRLEDSDGSPRYMGVTISGVKVGPSPDWLVRRLEAVGSRSINNVVDATNYLLHEVGQPMHAFDVARLGRTTVVIRRARPGERLRTLDGVDRALDPSMTVIADAERAQAVAGVMGGNDSEVGEGTTDIFLEVASFDARAVRTTRRALGLSTDASHRFERGVDRELTPVALARAVRLITAVAGGRVEGSPVDLYPSPAPARALLTLRAHRVATLLGQRLPAKEIVFLLRSIGFVADIVPGTEMLRGNEEIAVVAPSWRVDIEREVDLIEEVARLRGYDTFPDDLRAYRPTTVSDDPQWLLARRVREALVAAGLLETRPMPFVAGRDGEHLRVANPLAENEAHLRRSLLETLARRAEYNLARMQGDVRIFEIGAAFEPGAGALPRETMRAAAVIMGARRPPHFTERNPPAFDEWDARSIAELVTGAAFPAARAVLEPADGAGVLWNVLVEDSASNGGAPSKVGEVRRLRLDAPPWASPAFGIEVELARVENADVAPRGQSTYAVRPGKHMAGGSEAHVGVSAEGGGQKRAAGGSTARVVVSRTYQPLPTTPAAELDVALVVPENLSAERVEAVLRRDAGELLERLQLLDEYRGPHVPAGHRSLMWRLIFRHPERTLREKEVEGRREKLLKTLEKELGVRQRTS
ncbi:MAG TPA: phenylalanine--tRNA ligase subunit beta [Gemmatimonadaceae bacterium]|nr:phenylalanine--tRNA ligase subunit beta [Gemmatimonadaceae bacterium]